MVSEIGTDTWLMIICIVLAILRTILRYFSLIVTPPPKKKTSWTGATAKIKQDAEIYGL